MIKLNIGAGKTKKQGFISIDAFDEAADIIAPSYNTGYSENSVDVIYSSHMLEHLDGKNLFNTIEHWYNILVPGGCVTVLVPNAKVYLENWLKAEKDSDWEHIEGWGTRWIMGWEGKGDGMWHRNLFTPQTLKRLFEKYGFIIDNSLEQETRVKNKKHFEYLLNGDIMCIAIKK